MLSELIKEGHKITIFNRQLRISPAPLPKATRLIKGDRNCPQDLKYLFNQTYDAIIDISGYTPSHVEPIIRKYSSRIGQYIFISSTLVYKTPPPNPMTEESPRTFINNTSGRNKALTEDLLLKYKKVFPMKYENLQTDMKKAAETQTAYAEISQGLWKFLSKQ